MFDLRSPDPGRYPWSCHLSLQHRISRRFLQVSGATSVEAAAKPQEIVRQPTWSHLKGIDLCQVLTKWTRSFVSVKRQVWQFDRRSWDGFVWEFTIHIPHVPAKQLQCPVCVDSGSVSRNKPPKKIGKCPKMVFFRVISHKCYCTWFSIEGENPWVNDEWCCLPHKIWSFYVMCL